MAKTKEYCDRFGNKLEVGDKIFIVRNGTFGNKYMTIPDRFGGVTTNIVAGTVLKLTGMMTVVYTEYHPNGNQNFRTIFGKTIAEDRKVPDFTSRCYNVIKCGTSW